MSFFEKLKQGLSKTRQNLVGKVEELVAGKKAIDDSIYDELEDILIQADVGAEVSAELVDKLRQTVKERKTKDPAGLKPLLKEIIRDTLEEGTNALNMGEPPTVVLVIGVNGAGKTTTIGKLSHRFVQDGRKVIIAASDTFRAAAIDQLEILSSRVGAEVIKHQEGSDPAAVAFDALQAAKARKADVLIVDTAGRLHIKSNLMEELKKIARVLSREAQGAPQEILLVLDATNGQNALTQARTFGAIMGVTGIVLTKLDSTAKGGIIIGIKGALGTPVKFVGVGEKIDDLQPFNAEEFVDALFA